MLEAGERDNRLRAAAAEPDVAVGRRHRAIFGSGVEFAIVATDRDGRVTDWNAGAERILGWSAAEMQGEPADCFFTPEDRAEGRVGFEMQLALEAGRADDERWHMRQDGSRFWASGEMVPLRDEDGAHLGFLKVLRDRTEQRRAAEAQRADAEFLRSVLASSGDCIKVLDLEGRLTFMSERGQQAMEISDFNAVRGCPWPNFWHDEANVTARAALDAARAGGIGHFQGMTNTMAGTARHWDVQVTPILGADGRPEKILSVSRDITAAKVAEQRLRESEDNYRHAVDLSPQTLYTARPDGQLDHVGPRWREWTGMSGLGSGWGNALHPDDLAPTVAAWTRAVTAGGLYDIEHRVRMRDGSYRWMHSRAYPRRDGAGRTVRWYGTTEDVHAERVAADALHESEVRFRNMADHAPVMMWVTDAEGRCTYLNRLWYEFTGQTEAEALGLGWTEATHPDDQAMAERVFLSANAARAAFQIEYRLRRADGAYRWAVDAASPRFGDDGAFLGFVGSVVDVTARKQAEDVLRAANETLEAQVAERTRERDRIWAVSQDLLGVATFDGRFVSSNPAWEALLGWTEREVRETPFLDFLHPNDRASTAEKVGRLGKGARTLRFENRYRTKAGGYCWLSWTAVPEDGLIYAIGRDVTAEKRAGAALERSEARMRTLFDTSRQLQGLVAPDGTLLDANLASLAAIGARLEDVVGKPFWDAPWFAGTPGMAEAVRAAVSAAAAGEEGVRQEVELHLPVGRRIYEVAMRPLRDARGAVFAVVPDATDVTERRRTEEALRQSQKMEAVGQLTGGLAHDFNNLLAGISGSLELLQARVAQGRTGDLERYITAAQGASKRAAALTHRLLAFSRRQTLDPKPTDMNRLIAGMEELVRRTVGPAVKLEVVGAAGLWATLVDPNQLENALLNLCINARDAMPDGGQLTVETGNRWLDERGARERGLQPGQYVSLCVSDTGVGMAPEVARRAFDPFFTTKPIGMGTGLGLSMIHGFVQQSGGQARIYSEPGQGAMVRLYLPRHLGAAEAAEAPAELSAAPRAGQGETVLVVDDEATVRMLVTEVLEDLGYVAIEAADGAAGLKVLRSDVHIDLLVTDVGLPGGVNGRQMADAARERRPGLKVLFITGYAENAVLGHGHLDPGMRVLTKPFAMEALASRIKSLIADA